MTEYDYELHFLEAAVTELKRYLFSDETYWNIGLRAPGGSRPYPQFSLGWLLVFQRRLAAVDTVQSRAVLQKIETTRSRWESAWSRKAEKEFSMRLKLWTNFMNDLRNAREANRDRYAYEVQRRTMLELLAEDAAEVSSEEAQLLRTMDRSLQGWLRGDSFIENETHAAQFPKDRFWFLYGTLQ